MASYVYIQNYQKAGTIGISSYSFKQIAENACNTVEGVRLDKDSNSGTWSLSKPITVIIKDDTKVDINISISITGKLNVHQTAVKIQEAVAERLMIVAETVPFRINVKVVSMKNETNKGRPTKKK